MVLAKIDITIPLLPINEHWSPLLAAKKATYQCSTAHSNLSFVRKDNHPRIFINLGVVL